MDIAAWLRSLGLGQYEPVFRDNDIDAELVPLLTVGDLKGSWHRPVGHRRKLLDAITTLNLEAGSSESVPAQPTRSAPPFQSGRPQQPEGVRRQLTILGPACSAGAQSTDCRGGAGQLGSAFDEASAHCIGAGGGVLADHYPSGMKNWQAASA